MQSNSTTSVLIIKSGSDKPRTLINIIIKRHEQPQLHMNEFLQHASELESNHHNQQIKACVGLYQQKIQQNQPKKTHAKLRPARIHQA